MLESILYFVFDLYLLP